MTDEPIDPLASAGFNIQGELPAAAAGKGKKSAPAAAVDKTSDAYMNEKIWVQFMESDEMPPHGIPIGINGVAYLIRPGTPVKVARKVLHAADNAKTDKPVFDANQKVVGYRSITRFPYTRVDDPS